MRFGILAALGTVIGAGVAAGQTRVERRFEAAALASYLPGLQGGAGYASGPTIRVTHLPEGEAGAAFLEASFTAAAGQPAMTLVSLLAGGRVDVPRLGELRAGAGFGRLSVGSPSVNTPGFGSGQAGNFPQASFFTVVAGVGLVAPARGTAALRLDARIHSPMVGSARMVGDSGDRRAELAAGLMIRM